jgi:hypothetical protein
MKDKSGRELKVGDLVVCFRNKSRLEELEYAIVVAEGKVYNGNSCYTVGDYSYLCALTPSEQEIQSSLYSKYMEQSQKSVKRKQVAKSVKEVGQVFETEDYYAVYLGKVSCKCEYVNNNGYLKTKAEKGILSSKGGYMYLYLAKKDSSVSGRDAKKKELKDKILTDKKLDVLTLPVYKSYLNNFSSWSCTFSSPSLYSYDILVTVNKTSAVDSILDMCELENWDVGSSVTFKMDYAKTDDMVITRTK